MRLRDVLAVVALGAPAIAGADKPDKKREEIRAFWMSGYSYCDVKVLSTLWKTSIEETKLRIGRKIGYGPTQINKDRRAALVNAEKNPALACKFHESGLMLDDAHKLAKRWNLGVAQAKTMVEKKIAAGEESAVLGLVDKAPWHQKHVEAYANSGYKYCDAKLLAGFWKSSIEKAKAYIGGKLVVEDHGNLDQMLATSRQAALKDPARRCSYTEASFTFEDMQKLSKLWKKSLSEAKALAGDKITAGDAEALRKLLGKR